MLSEMTSYICSMVDLDANRFYSISRPPTGELLHQHCPIRDLAASWDATTVLLECHNVGEAEREKLQSAIIGTLQAYPVVYGDEGVAWLDPDHLQEPSNIAHSALYLLAWLGAVRLDFALPHDNDIVNGLTRGILSRQGLEGAFKSSFLSDDVYTGIDFFPGEAMVGLMQVYQHQPEASANYCALEDSIRERILSSMHQAFRFYSNYYHQGDTDTNYNIWQIQAFTRFWNALLQAEQTGNGKQAEQEIAAYILDMCEDIPKSVSWKLLKRGRSFYPNLQTVEIACGLDALAQGLGVAAHYGKDEELYLLKHYSNHALQFLLHVQEQVPQDALVGHGGLGFGGVQVLEQRLDVTGHAMSALVGLIRPTK
ncbi:expressed unknown protein [Seminavis robusta]|uniref:Uncharacterized protein n=1 Tax=Seminavis robusta TaxID=568900 RepID=A0A9N8EXZ3_9STRA|nr:expressed unknown protein [Seminavis robusta]|eukprot:Sro2462_g328360.1 n/a (368) ;mRNA; r:11077-12180